MREDEAQMRNPSPLYGKAIVSIRACREQTLRAWDEFIEGFDIDEPKPRVTGLKFDPEPSDRRDACIAAYDEAIDYLIVGGKDARQRALAALEQAAELEDEAGMVLRARQAMKSLEYNRAIPRAPCR